MTVLFAPPPLRDWNRKPVDKSDTHRLLRQRSALTSQPYSDDTITAWHDALADWDYETCARALTIAARHEKRITVAHIADQLPKATPTPPAQDEQPSPLHDWPGPTPRGRQALATLQEHTRGAHKLLPHHDCTACETR